MSIFGYFYRFSFKLMFNRKTARRKKKTCVQYGVGQNFFFTNFRVNVLIDIGIILNREKCLFKNTGIHVNHFSSGDFLCRVLFPVFVRQLAWTRGKSGPFTLQLTNRLMLELLLYPRDKNSSDSRDCITQSLPNISFSQFHSRYLVWSYNFLVIKPVEH